MSWKDSRLSWEPVKYGDIRKRVHSVRSKCGSKIAFWHTYALRLRSIHLAPELIWHPKFSVINRLNEFTSIDERINQAEIDQTGNSTYKIKVSQIVPSSTNMSLSYGP